MMEREIKGEIREKEKKVVSKSSHIKKKHIVNGLKLSIMRTLHVQYVNTTINNVTKNHRNYNLLKLS